MTEKLPTIEELRAEIIIELTCDTEDERDDCIDAKLLNDRLAIAEAVRDRLKSQCPARHDGGSNGDDYHPHMCWCDRIRALNLAEIVKGNP